MARRRLDAELVRRGLVGSRQAAKLEIESRNVLVGGAIALKATTMVDPGQSLRLLGPGPKYVSRAGNKLSEALEQFAISPLGMRCLDIGSSTGGFTDCLLQAGAREVVAVDVGTNQLHEKIRSDSRVDVREQTDARSLLASEFHSLFDLVVSDVSFISLRLILPAIIPLANSEGTLVLLVKPQFEAGRQEAARGRGVITDPTIWRRILHEVLTEAHRLGANLTGIMPSSTRGTSGNVEFVTSLRRTRSSILDNEGAIDEAIGRATASNQTLDGQGSGDGESHD